MGSPFGYMSWLPESKDHLPLTWWKGKPVFLSAILALVAAASIVLTALIIAAAPDAIQVLVFSYENVVEHFYFWTPFTYSLVNPPGFFIVIGCYLLWTFGETVERHLGRRAFVRLMLALLLMPPLLTLIMGALGMQGPKAAGFMAIEFGVFLAFATLYPRAQITLLIITIEAWILAAIFVGVAFLSALASRDVMGLIFLVAGVGTAWGMVRYEQGLLTLPTLPTFPKRSPRDLPRARVVDGNSSKDTSSSNSTSSGGGRQPAQAVAKKRPASPDVDAILEKISRDGIQSLTTEERAVLDKASADLQRRG